MKSDTRFSQPVFIHCNAGQVDSSSESHGLDVLLKFQPPVEGAVKQQLTCAQLATNPPVPISLQLQISESAQVVRESPRKRIKLSKAPCEPVLEANLSKHPFAMFAFPFAKF